MHDDFTCVFRGTRALAKAHVIACASVLVMTPLARGVAPPIAPSAPVAPPTTTPTTPATSQTTATSTAPAGMVWIRGGEFLMGGVGELAREDELPCHRVRVDGFWMDITEVTNAQFAQFIEATHYKTVAERDVDWEELKKQVPAGTPKPSDEMLRAGSLVFAPPSTPVQLRDASQWWAWTTGASWRHPAGPASDLVGKDDLPVVQIAYEDALAYAKWADKRLPTEAEWEFAARGGLEGKANVWGDEPVDATRCNTWQGSFPTQNTAQDGFVGAAPVKSFPANGFGLYDMAGNVWEWCSDRYRYDLYARREFQAGKSAVTINPTGPDTSADPRHPGAPELRVHRGGSFLCNDSYCASYRPSARMSTPPDTSLAHLGFRCVRGDVVAKVDAVAPALPATPAAVDAPGVNAPR